MAIKLNDDLIDTLCTEIKRGVNYTRACQIARISPSTFYSWKKKGAAEPEDSDSIYRKFYDEIMRAEALSVAYRVEGIRKAGEGGAWAAHAWWLERVFPQEFGRRQVIDANIDASVKQVNLSELFDTDEIKKILNEDEDNLD